MNEQDKTLEKKEKKKEKKRHPNWKGRSKIIFAEDIILYIENPKDSIDKKLLELKNEFSKISR